MKEKDREKRIHSSGLRLVRQEKNPQEFEPEEDLDLEDLEAEEDHAPKGVRGGKKDPEKQGAEEDHAPKGASGGKKDPEKQGAEEDHAPKGVRGGKKSDAAEYHPDFGDDDGEWEEEEEPASPWITALTFLGMAVLAAIICAILWYFTHPDKPEDSGQGQVMTEEDAAPDSEPGMESGTEPSGEPDEEPTESDTPIGGTETDGETGGEDSEMSSEGGGQEEFDEQPEEIISGTAAMEFSEVKESVTPKDVVNLRSVPTTANEEDIVVQCRNGEVLTRIGINKDTGWSKVEYGGETLYAVTQYLTTDLDYKPPVQQSDPNRVSTISGRIIIFSNCDDWISPKEYVNLRTEPSTTEGDSTVSCQLNYGEKVHRTGYSADSGWSRVEYNGQVLYVVTSLMNVAEE